MADLERSPGRHAIRIGSAMVVIAAIGFGVSPSGAKLSYTGGVEPLTLVALRFGVCAVCLGALVLGRRTRFTLDRSAWPLALLMGCIFISNAWCYMSAVRYIPVSLAVPLFYTFPIQVGLFAALIGEDKLDRRRVIAFAVAFVGVALTVGVGMAGADGRGVVLALIAGTGVAWTTVLFSRGARRNQSLTLGFWMMLVAACISGLIALSSGGLSWPQTPLATQGFLITLFCFSGALMLFYLAIPMTGPVRAAMFANLEPIFALIFATVILAERPGWAHLTGAMLVIGAVIYQSRAQDLTAARPATVRD